jgi:phosphoserine phosphatase
MAVNGISSLEINEGRELHLVDMDGTILVGSTASVNISRALGCEERVAGLEDRLARGEFDAREFASQTFDLWSDLTPEVVQQAFRETRWIDGMKEVFADIRSRGGFSAIITASPDFFAEMLHDVIDVDLVVASRFPPPPFRVHRFNPRGVVMAADKAEMARYLWATCNFDPSMTVGYGDSRNDIELASEVKRFVAVNPRSKELEEIAPTRYLGNDFRKAYEEGRKLLSVAMADPRP